MVSPDLEETRKRVLAGSMEPATCNTREGTVESSTVNLRPLPAEAGATRRRTSAPRLLPPIPSRTTSRKPLSLASSAKALSRGTSPRMASVTASQPRRSEISWGEGFQTVWSPLHIRRTTALCSIQAKADSTPPWQAPKAWSVSLTRANRSMGQAGRGYAAAAALGAKLPILVR